MKSLKRNTLIQNVFTDAKFVTYAIAVSSSLGYLDLSLKSLGNSSLKDLVIEWRFKTKAKDFSAEEFMEQIMSYKDLGLEKVLPFKGWYLAENVTQCGDTINVYLIGFKSQPVDSDECQEHCVRVTLWIDEEETEDESDGFKIKNNTVSIRKKKVWTKSKASPSVQLSDEDEGIYEEEESDDINPFKTKKVVNDADK